MIWDDGTDTGDFTFYYSQDTELGYLLLKFKATGSFSYDYIQDAASFTDFNIEYAMEDAGGTLQQGTWYDASYFNIDAVKDIVARNVGVSYCAMK